MTSPENAGWSGPGVRAARGPFTWRRFVWAAVYPEPGDRFMPTLPGIVLIGLAFGIGMAAYNSSSNILFITLSLLLACLILSGVLSWLNLRGVRWRLELAAPWRVGHDAVVALDLENRKRFLPTYGLWFGFAARPVEPPAAPESAGRASAADVRAAFAHSPRADRHGEVSLAGRLDPETAGRIEWVTAPTRRGRWAVELERVGSLFPFGFLRKELATTLTADVIVWPAPIEYRRHPVTAARRVTGGERVARAGHAGDLLALRRYASGDSHRLIHWKASARTRTLLVRQFAAETAEGYSLWLQTDAELWPHPEQFELLVALAATLAEDLFRAGRLQSVAIDADAPVNIRRGHDLEAFLDRLAELTPQSKATAGASERRSRQNVMTFAPDGPRGVVAFVGGEVAASA